MYILHRKRVLAAAIATLLATPAVVSAHDTGKPHTGMQTGSETSQKADTGISSRSGKSTSESTYLSDTDISSGPIGDSGRYSTENSATGRASADMDRSSNLGMSPSESTIRSDTDVSSGTVGDSERYSAEDAAMERTSTDIERSSDLGMSPSDSAVRSDTDITVGTIGESRNSIVGDSELGQSTDSDRSRSNDMSPSDSAYGASTAASAGATGDSASMRSDAENRMAANPLYSRSADELKGTDIVDASGEKIGDIKEVVLSSDRRSAHAIVGVGGFLGMGERDIEVSLEELKAHDGDELQLSVTKEALRARPQYQSDQYSELEGDQAISGSITDFSAFETDVNSNTGQDRGSNMDDAMDKALDNDSRRPSTGASSSYGTDASSETGISHESRSSTTQ